jgi:hypothetical protein
VVNRQEKRILSHTLFKTIFCPINASHRFTNTGEIQPDIDTLFDKSLLSWVIFALVMVLPLPMVFIVSDAVLDSPPLARITIV